MGSQKGRQKTVVEGVITPTEWNEDDEVVGIALYTDDEEEYQVELSGRGRVLLDFLDERVELRGSVRSGADGAHVFDVEDFEVLGDEDEEEEEGDDEDFDDDDDDDFDDEDLDDDFDEDLDEDLDEDELDEEEDVDEEAHDEEAGGDDAFDEDEGRRPRGRRGRR